MIWTARSARQEVSDSIAGGEHEYTEKGFKELIDRDCMPCYSRHQLVWRSDDRD